MMALMGTMSPRPAAPSGRSSVIAASGPYAAELKASRPSSGMPATTPTFWPSSSREESGLPKTKSRKLME